MAAVTKDTLKSLFASGQTTSEENFTNFIDTMGLQTDINSTTSNNASLQDKIADIFPDFYKILSCMKVGGVGTPVTNYGASGFWVYGDDGIFFPQDGGKLSFAYDNSAGTSTLYLNKPITSFGSGLTLGETYTLVWIGSSFTGDGITLGISFAGGTMKYWGIGPGQNQSFVSVMTAPDTASSTSWIEYQMIIDAGKIATHTAEFYVIPGDWSGAPILKDIAMTTVEVTLDDG